MPLFRHPRFDLVIVAARYREAGSVEWVRAFERRGPTWSDRTLIRRDELIARIEAGEKAVTGARIPLQASSFKVGDEVRVEQRNGRPVLVAGGSKGEGDSLGGLPEV